MGYKPTVFNPLFNFISRPVLEKTVKLHGADRYAQIIQGVVAVSSPALCLGVGQAVAKEYCGGLQLHRSILYHLGLSPVARSTIFDGMERRSSKVFEEMFYAMVRKTGALALGLRFRVKNPKKTVLGTSKNAVMAQVWIAMIYDLLLAYIKFMSKTSLSLTDFARWVKEGIMMQIDLLELLCRAEPKHSKSADGQDIDQMVSSL